MEGYQPSGQVPSNPPEAEGGAIPMYRFYMRGTPTAVDRSGYYRARWDKFISIDLMASTADEAREKARALMGDARSGREWGIIIDRVSDAEEPEQ